MAQEFADFLEEMKRRPVEEKVQALSIVIEKLIQIVLNMTDDIGTNLNFFKTEIGTIKTEIGTLKMEHVQKELKELKSPSSPNLSQPQKLSSPPHPPPKIEKPKNIEIVSPRSAIMGELKELFKKRDGSSGK